MRWGAIIIGALSAIFLGLELLGKLLVGCEALPIPELPQPPDIIEEVTF